jgi:hypothetical protein
MNDPLIRLSDLIAFLRKYEYGIAHKALRHANDDDVETAIRMEGGMFCIQVLIKSLQEAQASGKLG